MAIYLLRTGYKHIKRIWSVPKLRRVILASSALFALSIGLRAVTLFGKGYLQDQVLIGIDFLIPAIEALAPNLLASIAFYLMLAEGTRAIHGVNIVKDRSPDLIMKNLKDVGHGENVDILDISLRSHLSSDADSAIFLSGLRAILDKEDCTIRILLANPDSPVVTIRAMQLYEGDSKKRFNYREELIVSLRKLAEFSEQLDSAKRKRFNVKLYTDPPGIAYYAFGLQCYACLYPQSETTDNVPNLAFQDNEFQVYFADHFKAFWGNQKLSKPLQTFRQAQCVMNLYDSTRGENAFNVWFVNQTIDSLEGKDMVHKLQPRYLLCEHAVGGVALSEAYKAASIFDLRERSGLYSPPTVSLLLDSYEQADDTVKEKFSWVVPSLSGSYVAGVCPVAYDVTIKGFSLYKTQSLSKLLMRPSLLSSFEGLGPDPYYDEALKELNPEKPSHMLSKRKRALGNYKMEWNGVEISSLKFLDPEDPQEHPNQASFYQRPEVNKASGGITRWFKRIDEVVSSDEIIGIIKADFIRFAPFIKPASIAKPQEWNVTVHQVRVICPAKGEGHPTPEGIHCDGHDLLVIHVLRRENIDPTTGATSIYQRSNVSSKNANPDLRQVIDPGSSLFINDQEVLHCVSHFESKAKNKEAFRDVLLVDFDLVDNYPHCNT